MKENKICIGTSIAPDNYCLQHEAVKSWIEEGFDVVSVNTIEEKEVLREPFSDLPVRFVAIDRWHTSDAGKKLPYIRDILSSVVELGYSNIGYSNSDILLKKVDRGFYEFLRTESLDKIVLIHRNEISKSDDIEDMNFKINFDGFDCFFLKKEFCGIFDETELCVQSCWDTFIQSMARRHGIKTAILSNPIAFHYRHIQKWNFNQFSAFCFEMRGFQENVDNRNPAGYSFLEFYRQMLCQSECIAYSEREVAFKISANPLVEFDNSFNSTISWILANFRVNAITLPPFIISDFDNGKTFAPLCTCLPSLENFAASKKLRVTVHKAESNVGYTGDKTAFICLPICYLNVGRGSSLLSRHRLTGDVYIAPAGIRARIWASANEENLTNCNFKGFLDNFKQAADIFQFDVIKDKSDITILVATKYFYKEIVNQVSAVANGWDIVDSSSICYFDRDGYCYSL